jgi:hypothetical protein
MRAPIADADVFPFADGYSVTVSNSIAVVLAFADVFSRRLTVSSGHCDAILLWHSGSDLDADDDINSIASTLAFSVAAAESIANFYTVVVSCASFRVQFGHAVTVAQQQPRADPYVDAVTQRDGHNIDDGYCVTACHFERKRVSHSECYTKRDRVPGFESQPGPDE